MGNRQKAQIESLTKQVSDLEAKNQELFNVSKAKEDEHRTEIARINEEWKQKHETTQQANEVRIHGFEVEIETLKKEIAEKQVQLDRKELKKLAAAYNEQEGVYESAASRWLRVLIGVAISLVISAGVSIYLSVQKPWYEKFEYYVVDIILISAVWFCSSQYTYLVKLRNDYANRKTLAQSFHNILSNLPEDEPIKKNFIEKATDVLCAPSLSLDKEPVLSKKVFKDTAEIIGAVSGK
ncbi:MAG: hypothetical protein HYW65_02315 [Candidatus Liptonbacteria bacterium]|nr:hypothetical protein [Candidatus Liptonbacteria bacterium]